MMKTLTSEALTPEALTSEALHTKSEQLHIDVHLNAPHFVALGF
jgi:hypothetical protein